MLHQEWLSERLGYPVGMRRPSPIGMTTCTLPIVRVLRNQGS